MSKVKPPLTAYICWACRKANREDRTHPGANHMPGICDCPCREKP